MSETSIHDEVKQLLSDVQSELKELERVSGHDLLRLRDGLASALHGIRIAKGTADFQEPPIEAGAGAVATEAGELHPERVQAEAQPETAERYEQLAEKEPDPAVREKVRAGAEQARAASERAGTSKK